MDNVTHAALGIAAGIVVRRRGASLPAAALAGLLAAEAPDLDVFIRSAGDPLVSFRWHRHFTHSFAFMPVWALLSALIAGWCFRRRDDADWRDLLLPGLAGALTHLLCDGCTSYGTMLLWPFDQTRFAWDCLPIIDLFATLPVLVLALLAWKKASPRLALYGLIWFTSYALLGVWQHARAETALRAWFAEKQVRAERVAVKPTALNLLVWRCLWLEDGVWRTAAVRVAPFAAPRILVGETRAALTSGSSEVGVRINGSGTKAMRPCRVRRRHRSQSTFLRSSGSEGPAACSAALLTSRVGKLMMLPRTVRADRSPDSIRSPGRGIT